MRLMVFCIRRLALAVALPLVIAVAGQSGALAQGQGKAPGADGPASVDETAEKSASFKMMTIERRPFAMMMNRKLVGFSIDLWHAMAEELGLETDFEVATQFSEMLGKVERREADAAIANITITSVREETMDFTQPIFDSGIQVLVRDKDAPMGLVGALFNWEMLGLIVLAGVILFIIANLMWFFERREQPYFQYPYQEGIWRSFWWALNVIVNGGFEERVPQTRRGRAFAVVLVIASLFLVSAFVAKITASLTVSELKAQIQSYRDLFNRRVGTTAGSTSAAFLDFHSVPYRRFERMDDVFKALEQGELDAIVHDAPVLRYYANTAGRGQVRLVGSMLRPEKYGIALQAGSPYREQIDRILLKMREDGRYDELYRRWFGRNP
jgi:polar amino acid transport system substrate-binding protein